MNKHYFTVTFPMISCLRKTTFKETPSRVFRYTSKEKIPISFKFLKYT